MELHVASKYRLIKKLGGGSFGDIYHAQHIVSEEDYAIKLVSECCCSNVDECVVGTSQFQS
jgi:hypothetical protein